MTGKHSPAKPNSPTRARQVREAMNEALPPWGVLVLESHHAPDFSMQWRTHRFLKVVYFLSGAGTFCCNKQELNFQGGDVFVVAPNDRNRICDGEGTPSSLYVGCICQSILSAEPTTAENIASSKLVGGTRQSNFVASTLRRMIYTQDLAASSRGVDMMIDAWRLIRGVTAYDSTDASQAVATESTTAEDQLSDAEIVERYIRELQTSFLEATTIDAAANQLNLSRRTFTHLFREQTGTTWLRRVRELGIEHAKRLLQETDLPIASVAFESGFADISTFYRRFTSMVGQSPAAYRQRSTCR
ncbi:AraC family transcriptional regulator [Rhodopirellula sp. JC740]|uniref:AraC family transcriptional regulator n=1 Tax=Rhodopirellula halodulae TaxID=2894198 RepID=A0ABS8NJ19_9BACT|nr:AraC family transcriptional regulator [Rhodopirellula sp. JC740]MCC9643553.1 AraC family transcriptional regulator [Rhodopirellula sp. JC740]